MLTKAVSANAVARNSKGVALGSAAAKSAATTDRLPFDHAADRDENARANEAGDQVADPAS